MHLDTKLIAMDAADAKTLANSTSRRPESNGRRPGPGFGQNPGGKKLKLDFAYPSNPGSVYMIHQLAPKKDGLTIPLNQQLGAQRYHAGLLSGHSGAQNSCSVLFCGHCTAQTSTSGLQNPVGSPVLLG